MAHVGGLFLASTDPARLIDWFEARFGWTFERDGDGGYHPFEGTSVLSVMSAAEGTPVPPAGDVAVQPYGRQPVMGNLAVDDLDAVLARMHEAGEATAGPQDFAPLGRFAWVRTPDGHDLELWQPA